MKKKIIISSQGVVVMSFEEVLKQFEQMIEKFANSTINKIVYNKPEKEELLQELHLQAWEAFKRYDITKGHAFSTYLVYRLQLGIGRGTAKLYAQKRTNTKGTVSLNEVMGGDDGELELEGLLGEEDFDITSLAFREFLTELEKILTPVEKYMLKVLLDKGDFSVQDLADTLGMSRQGANKKIVKFKEKMKVFLNEGGFVAC